MIRVVKVLKVMDVKVMEENITIKMLVAALMYQQFFSFLRELYFKRQIILFIPFKVKNTIG